MSNNSAFKDALNISQSLFKLDESLAARNDKYPGGVPPQFTAYLNQSKMSTWYQDRPVQTLLFENTVGVPTLGGPLDGSAIVAANTYESNASPVVVATQMPVPSYQGVFVPQFVEYKYQNGLLKK